MRLLFATLICTAHAVAVYSQGLQPQDDTQSWNEVQVTKELSEKFELFGSITGRFGKNITRLNDGRLAIGLNYKPVKSLSILPYYWFIRARNSTGRFNNEHRINVRATYRFPIKSFGLAHRSTYEYRIREPQNSWRYRAALTLEKSLPKKFLKDAKFFATEEIFYDSILDRFSRNRFSIGVNKTLTPKLSLDIYYMRQNDGFSRPGDLNVIGTTWRVKL